MTDVTEIMSRIESGDSAAAEELLPLVYDDLRRMARAKMAGERVDHTLHATALVHEAYLRLLNNSDPNWQGRRHFFGAAAEAMRRILIEHARSKNSLKRRPQGQRLELDDHASADKPAGAELEDLLALDEALAHLAADAPAKAELVKLRYFAGLTLDEAAEALGISLATAKRYWVYARAYLFDKLQPADGP
jgi:RNA polymerase sigma factor (TIGR02999 family)